MSPTAVKGVVQHFMLSKAACDVDACCALVPCAGMVLYSLHCVSTDCRVIAVLITGEQV